MPTVRLADVGSGAVHVAVDTDLLGMVTTIRVVNNFAPADVVLRQGGIEWLSIPSPVGITEKKLALIDQFSLDLDDTVSAGITLRWP